MGWLNWILGERDPYETGFSARRTQFFAEGVYYTSTAYGYAVRYSLTCHFEKVDRPEFKRAKMLRDGADKTFLDVVNREVVIPALRAKDRFVRLTFARPHFPALCRTDEVDGEKFVMCDNACIELNADLKGSRFTRFGCAITALDFRFRAQPQADETIEENYERMIKLHDVNSIKNTPGYAAVEEATMVAFAKRELELRRQFTQNQTNRTHKGEYLDITTCMVGRSVELKWTFKKPLAGNEVLRGYRKENGFWTGTLPPENNGTCIADSKSADATILHLAAGTDHYFTFVILRAGPQVQQIVETLRFSVRVASLEELARVDELIAKAAGLCEQKNKLSEKTEAALKELMTFIEFDENVSELEKQLVERISSKDYSDDEKEEKIQRLKDVVQSLRIEHS